jgi:hypothetical protein
VTPVHYCEPVPDVHHLPDRLWRERDDLVGIRMNDEEQMKLLDDFSSRFKAEYTAFPLDRPVGDWPFYVHNGWFSAGDAEMLYCFVRHLRPRRIIEIGSGYSTLVTCSAITANKTDDPNYECNLISVEPYPRRELLNRCQHVSEEFQLPLQEVPLSVFNQLTSGDILFIDSSHVASCGSDVNHAFFRILPALPAGVFVHIHDIFIPFEYPESWIKDQKLFWNEQYLVRAFLTFNCRFEVVWAAHYMSRIHEQRFTTAIPSVRPKDHPASFWLRSINS